ncbi:MAG: hypothetical protein CFE24_13495 [Flavobacterium sp. BFFFF2]|nr:MAG: hypothetical protein CFE24_13495 [Flavobacterium sp. BFFFF2]
MKLTSYIVLLCGLLTCSAWSQQAASDSLKIKQLPEPLAAKPVIIDPLRPAKAAFYSALVPGLGQAYNKKYWKIPIVYAALGTTIYFYITNNNKYNEFRDIYKNRLEGIYTDPYPNVDNSRIVTAQQFYQRNRDLSMLLTVAFYALNIIEANVDAHLMQFNVSDNLSFQPDILRHPIDRSFNPGLALRMSF